MGNSAEENVASMSADVSWLIGEQNFHLTVEDLTHAPSIVEWARQHNARFLHIQFGDIRPEDHVMVAKDIANRPKEFYQALSAAFPLILPVIGGSTPEDLWDHLAKRMASDVEYVATHLEPTSGGQPIRCCVCAQAIVTGVANGQRSELYGFNVACVTHCPCS